MAKEKLYLIDGSGFIFRAYHALPPLKRSDGTPVGAVLGFCNMMVKLLKDMEAYHIAVVFDAGRKTFRNDLYPEYKANRSETPEDLIPQFPIIRQACKAFGVPSLELKEYEADDLIAAYTDTALQKHMEVIIVSSDKDLMQLVGPSVRLYDPMKSVFIDESKVVEKFGVHPTQVIDVQALAGDASDNIPGVPGIGVKTASQLIKEFHTLENLLKNTSKIPQVKRRELLETYTEQAKVSKILVSLNHQTPLPLPLKDLKPTLKKDILRPFLQEQELKALEKRLFGMQEKAAVSTYETVLTTEHLEEWIESVKKSKVIGFDTETDSLNAMQANLAGISFSTAMGKACYIPVYYQEEPALISMSDINNALPLQQVLDIVKPILENKDILKVGHNIKYDKLVLQKYGIEVRGYGDSMLMSYLLYPGRHGLDVLVEEYLQHKMTTFKELTGTGKAALKFHEVDLAEATQYAAADADYTLRLYALFSSNLAPVLKKLYDTLDIPLVDVLVDMEKAGIKVDPTVLKNLSIYFSKKLKHLEKEVFTLAGCEFNIGSPKQLGDVLFNKLKLGEGKKSKLGAYITSSDVLEDLSTKHPLPEKVLEWRQISKLKSTYTDNLIAQINPTTHRLHTSYGMASTSTGRLSSSDPNLQNIPIRTEEGQKIRQCFVAESGHYLLSFDYSQIELRLLAHFAHIPTLEKAFKEGQDIHALTASQVFNVPLEEITPEVRNKAKAINFGIIYGISPFGLAKQLKIDRAQAAHYIKLYHEQYPGITRYMEETVAFARQHGYVETLWGRRCYIPNIGTKNPILKAFAERQAINAPLQGTNADIIKKTMIQIHAWLQEEKLQTKMLLQVHDELIFESPLAEVDTVFKPIQLKMESIAALKVPLIVGIGKGKNWQETHL